MTSTSTDGTTAARPTVEAPEAPGMSDRLHRGPAFRRYATWFTITGLFTALIYGAGTILLPNEVQSLVFPLIFRGADGSVDLVALQHLSEQIAAGTATATGDQARQLDLLREYNAVRAQNYSLVTSISLIVSMILTPIIGVLSDRTKTRWGRRAPWILVGGLAGAACIAALRFAPSVPVVALLWAVGGVGIASLASSLTATVADRVAEERRGLISGFAGFSSFVGGTIGGVAAGIGFAFLGLDLFFVFALLIAVGAVGFVLFARDRSSKELVAPTRDVKALFTGFAVPFRARDFRLVLIARILLAFGYAVSTALNLYMLQAYVRPALSAAEATATAPLIALVGIPGTLVTVLIAGRISDKVGRRKPFVVAASILMGLALLIPLVSPSLGSLFLSSIVASIAFGVYIPVDQALTVDVLPDMKSAGRDLGVAAFGTNLGQALGPILAGAVVTISGGYALIWPVAALLVFLAALVILPVKKAR